MHFVPFPFTIYRKPKADQPLSAKTRHFGKLVNFGSKLARIISDAPPGGNIWYGRLVKQRLVMDQIQRLVDRDYA